MLKQQFWGLPRLYLCFFMVMVISSCAVKHDAHFTALTSPLEIKAWINPGESKLYLPLHDFEIPLSYEVGQRWNGTTNNLIITFHAGNLEQALSLKHELVETGQIENVVITYNQADP